MCVVVVIAVVAAAASAAVTHVMQRDSDTLVHIVLALSVCIVCFY